MDTRVFDQLLAAAVKNGASDVHLKAGAPPMFRLQGDLREVKAPKLQPEDTQSVVLHLLHSEELKQNIEKLRDHDTSYVVPEVGRFRVNIFRQRGSFAVILRIIPLEIPTFEQLGLPPVLAKIAQTERGLVLVTGVTGSGKSSTLAALVGEINRTHKRHILTIEDPIEFVHQDIKSSVSQREIGPDTGDFAVALRAALRQDPDVILVGEIRDRETVDIALKAAETGHLVLSTLHTTDAPKTINRLIGLFPMEEQNVVRMRVAESLQSIVSQRLLTKKDGKGRAVAAEILVTTMSIVECIKDAEKTPEIHEHMEKGRDMYGMQSFDQHLSDLYKADIITLEVAKSGASNPSDFERALHFE
jgi:twitching motility protein PilT